MNRARPASEKFELSRSAPAPNSRKRNSIVSPTLPKDAFKFSPSQFSADEPFLHLYDLSNETKPSSYSESETSAPGAQHSFPTFAPPSCPSSSLSDSMKSLSLCTKPEDRMFPPRSPIETFAAVSPRKLSRLLQDQNHSLCRSILSVSRRLGSNEDQAMRSIVSLHNQPDALLLHCLKDELLSKGDLSVIAREQTPTVFALKECLSHFSSSMEHLLLRFLKFGESLTSKHLRLLCDSFPRLEVDLSSSQKESHQRSCKHHQGCKHSLKLRKKLQKETMKLLSAGSIPIELCVLCHRCTLLIEQTPNVQRDESIPIENWAVTAFLFLRFIVPMVTTSSQREKNEKGISFLSRFLMKLCCRSKFRISGSGSGVYDSPSLQKSQRNKSVTASASRTCERILQEEVTRTRSVDYGGGDGDGVSLVNLILEDCFEAFDRFCSEIRERGRDFWGDQLQIERKLPVEWASEAWEQGIIVNFLGKHKESILLEAKKRDWEITFLLDFFCEELKKIPPPRTPRTPRTPLSPLSPPQFFLDQNILVPSRFHRSDSSLPVLSPNKSNSEDDKKQYSPLSLFNKRTRAHHNSPSLQPQRLFFPQGSPQID